MYWFLPRINMNQPYVHIFSLSWTPLALHTSYHPSSCQRALGLSSLCHAANSHWLSGFTYGNVSVSVLFYFNAILSMLSILSISMLFYHWLVLHMVMCLFQCYSINATLSNRCYSIYSIKSTLSFPHCVHKSVLYVCISIAVLKTGSSVPSF